MRPCLHLRRAFFSSLFLHHCGSFVIVEKKKGRLRRRVGQALDGKRNEKHPCLTAGVTRPLARLAKIVPLLLTLLACPFLLRGRAVCLFRTPRLIPASILLRPLVPLLFRLHRFPFLLPDLLQIGIPDLNAQTGSGSGGLLPKG